MDVHVNFPGTQLPGPDADPHYIVGPDGMYLRKKLSWVDATVKLEKAAMLDPIPVGVQLAVPPVSGAVLAAAIAFFRKVAKEHAASEAAVLLHYNQEMGWEYTVPDQKVNPAFVQYDTNQQLDGYECLGTIHSHGNAVAYHSPTDHHDEISFDGIHITVGYCHAKNGVSLSGQVVVNNNRFAYEDLHKIEGLTQVAELDMPFTWRAPDYGNKPEQRTDLFLDDTSVKHRSVSAAEYSRVKYHKFRPVAGVTPHLVQETTTVSA